MPARKEEMDRQGSARVPRGKSERPAPERSPLVGTVKKDRKPDAERVPALAGTSQVKQYSPLSLLSQVELATLMNVGVSTLRRIMQDPGFPKRRRLPSGLRGWIYREIEEYIYNLPVEGNDIDD